MIIGRTSAGRTLENRTSGSPKLALSAAIVRSQSITSSAAAHDVTLNRGVDRTFHGPRHHLELELRAQMVVRLGRVLAPVVRPRLSCRDVVSGIEAAAFGAQQNDAGPGVGIGPSKGFGQLVPKLRADRVELLRTVQGDDADLVVHLVQDQAIGHRCSPPKKSQRLCGTGVPVDPAGLSDTGQISSFASIVGIVNGCYKPCIRAYCPGPS